MNVFGGLTNDGLEETQDRLGGFDVFETDIYSGQIKVAYAGQSPGGARSVTMVVDFNGKEYRETVYITNKAGQNFFLNKDDKTKKVPLPGFTTIDDICLVTDGKPLHEQNAEDKMVNVYDPDAKKELPKSVPVLIDLIGKTVSLAISKVIENKSVKQSDGSYANTAETRTVNTIDKVFHTETKMTVAEARDGKETGAFWDAWIKRNKGKERDKRTIKDGQAGQVGRPGAGKTHTGPPQAGNSQAPKKSLFGDKKAS